jgi:hypothetical protein
MKKQPTSKMQGQAFNAIAMRRLRPGLLNAEYAD